MEQRQTSILAKDLVTRQDACLDVLLGVARKECVIGGARTVRNTQSPTSYY